MVLHSIASRMALWVLAGSALVLAAIGALLLSLTRAQILQHTHREAAALAASAGSQIQARIDRVAVSAQMLATIVAPRQDSAEPLLRDTLQANQDMDGLAAVFHALYERNGAEAVAVLPGGSEWVATIEAIPPDERHLGTHEGHLVRLTAVDEEAVALAADLLPQFTFSGTEAQLRDRVAEYEAGGVTELVYQPAGPDIVGELTRMMAAIGDAR